MKTEVGNSIRTHSRRIAREAADHAGIVEFENSNTMLRERREPLRRVPRLVPDLDKQRSRIGERIRQAANQIDGCLVVLQLMIELRQQSDQATRVSQRRKALDHRIDQRCVERRQ